MAVPRRIFFYAALALSPGLSPVNGREECLAILRGGEVYISPHSLFPAPFPSFTFCILSPLSRFAGERPGERVIATREFANVDQSVSVNALAD